MNTKTPEAKLLVVDDEPNIRDLLATLPEGTPVLATTATANDLAFATLAIGLLGIPALLRDGRAGANRVATRWIGYMLWAARLHLGVTCEVRGTPPTDDCIIAAKHQSFLDILAIAHAVPQCGFIMKREVMRVPIMGWYAWKVGCIPIDRNRGRDAMRAISTEINRRIAGEGIVLEVCPTSNIRTAVYGSYADHPLDRLRAAGCDAVVLGCTELPLVLDDANCALPTLDSTRILARAALARALRSAPARTGAGAPGPAP